MYNYVCIYWPLAASSSERELKLFGNSFCFSVLLFVLVWLEFAKDKHAVFCGGLPRFFSAFCIWTFFNTSNFGWERHSIWLNVCSSEDDGWLLSKLSQKDWSCWDGEFSSDSLGSWSCWCESLRVEMDHIPCHLQ